MNQKQSRFPTGRTPKKSKDNGRSIRITSPVVRLPGPLLFLRVLHVANSTSFRRSMWLV